MLVLVEIIKHAEAVKNFLNMFLECKIIPYVLFDGSTEGRKLETVLNRLKERIIRSSELNCTEDPENLQNACGISVQECFKADEYSHGNM